MVIVDAITEHPTLGEVQMRKAMQRASSPPSYSCVACFESFDSVSMQILDATVRRWRRALSHHPYRGLADSPSQSPP